MLGAARICGNPAASGHRPEHLRHTGFSMEVYLLRHAIAGPTTAGERDADRQLTDEGIRMLGIALARARSFGARPSLILSSPYARAIDTANIAMRELGCPRPPIATACLTPDSTPRAVWDEVRIYASEPSILLTSHEPLLSATAAWMLGPLQEVTPFWPSGLVCIDFATVGLEPRGVIRWDFRASH
jgi:phosphohistidine phosphatase